MRCFQSKVFEKPMRCITRILNDALFQPWRTIQLNDGFFFMMCKFLIKFCRKWNIFVGSRVNKLLPHCLCHIFFNVTFRMCHSQSVVVLCKVFTYIFLLGISDDCFDVQVHHITNLLCVKHQIYTSEVVS